jgi:MFS transporter, putative metabolite:H+ symporter
MINSSADSKNLKAIFTTTVIVAALGYFVDVYDLLLFLIVGKESLVALGVGPDIFSKEVNTVFGELLRIQMYGMLAGGIIWGVLGDKKGRLEVLFGSILMYSVANLANAFIGFAETDNAILFYKILRFVAGFGLAGELGVGITLVAEQLSKENRGYGTTAVAAIGVLGAIVASICAYFGTWQVCYIIGGVLGFSLLLMRISVKESAIFTQTKESNIERGNFFQLFGNAEIFKRYLLCILIGLPVWYIIGILAEKAHLFSKAFGIEQTILPELSIAVCYAGLTLGDICSGVISQWLKSRKKVFFIFYPLGIIMTLWYLFGETPNYYVFLTQLFLLGFAAGYWAVFVTVGSEQFGTNLRSTAATTIPNFVRGSFALISILFKWLSNNQMDLVNQRYAAIWIGAGVFAIAFIASTLLKETFGKDLDYQE